MYTIYIRDVTLEMFIHHVGYNYSPSRERFSSLPNVTFRGLRNLQQLFSNLNEKKRAYN